MSTDPAGGGRAAALLGFPVAGHDASPADLRWAAALLHDFVVWGLDRNVPDDDIRPVEQRLGRVAAELAQSDPALGALLDWWLAAVVGLHPQRLWDVHPLPDELAKAILPGGAPPNLGAEVKRRRYDEDLTRLFKLATSVPTLSSVAKAQSVVRDLNIELKPVLAVLDTGARPDPDTGRRLAERAEALLAGSGIGEGTPLHAKLKRELDDRAHLAADLASRSGQQGEPVEVLPAAKVKALTRLAKTADQVLAGRLLAALGGPPPRPEPSGLAIALGEAVDGLEEEDRFRAYRMLGGLADHVAKADPGEVPSDWNKDLVDFVEAGRRLDTEMTTALTDVEGYAAGDARELPALVRRALENGQLADARSWLADLSAAAGSERSRREATKALDRARNRGVTGELVDELAGAVARDDVETMGVLANQVRVLPGMDRRLTSLAGPTAPAEVARSGAVTTGPAGRQIPVNIASAPDLAVVTPLPLVPGGDGGGGGGVALATPLPRGWAEALAQPPTVKATPGYVIRVNAHNRFFDGRICTAPAGNKSCASSERFKLDFCEKGIARCNWLSAFAAQPRVELTDPFIEEYQPILDESPPATGDVAVLWAQTETGHEPIGVWRILTIAPGRRGWVLNGDRDAAVILPRGLVPWAAIYRRWSSPRGTQAMRVMDQTSLEGFLIQVRDALAALAAEDPATQRDVAALEVMLADQRARVPAPAAPAEAAGTAAATPAATAVDKAPASPAGNGAAQPDQVVAPTAKRGKKAVVPVPAPAPAPTLHERLRARGGFYSPALVSQYQLALAESRLVILAGPSGTGKTRLAGEAAAELEAAFRLVAVRPDWHANEDLLGYLPPFPGARFAATPTSEFIRSAAEEAAKAQADGRPARPFHLCLDEMNLARPEHYMSELLSKMEVPDGQIAFHTGAGTSDDRADDPAGFPAEVTYPANLVIIGTVNLDETTLPISAKILDRSAYLHVEAGELWAFLEHRPETAKVPAWIPRLLVDLDGSLDDAGQGLGYRVAERLLRWASMGAEQGHAPSDALDWALSAQVVPRLRFTRSDPSHLEVLEALVVRLRGAEGSFPRSVAQLERMLTELRRQDFTLGQMRLS